MTYRILLRAFSHSPREPRRCLKKIVKRKHQYMYVASIPDRAEFDFVVVGGGSAGCVVAARLSENSANRVLLIEAGGRDNHYKIHIPVLVAHILRDDEQRWKWPHRTEPQQHLRGRSINWLRGKVIGGSGSINGGVFVRGNPAEYDAWRDELGCTGWGYQDLLPYFKRLEHFPEGDPSVRGVGGPIHCHRLDKFSPLTDPFLEACAEAGYPKASDYNDGNYEGAFPVQSATRRGWRSSTAVGYLKPALRRPNLTVLTRATATRVLMGGCRAIGVEYVAEGKTFTVAATAEVVLSAGPMASCHLLELSGIGNPEILSRYGIHVVHALPGVGENLLDQVNSRLTFECSQPITYNDILRSPWRKLKEGLKFIFKGDGILAISATIAHAHIRSDASVAMADIKLLLRPMSGAELFGKNATYGLDPYPGFGIGVTLLRPKSTGSIHVQSPDPLKPAKMDPKYFSHKDDPAILMKGIQIARRVANQSALKPFVVRETRPGPAVGSEKELMDYLLETAGTSWHQVGTCKMGVDDMAVVDPTLKVRGLNGLRVIDSSIFPTIPSANTNISTIATAEKGAAMMSGKGCCHDDEPSAKLAKNRSSPGYAGEGPEVGYSQQSPGYSVVSALCAKTVFFETVPAGQTN
jgi:choline dehydrogenase